jgi:3-hydroxyisobutyrate dehydrogenase-like beta-hydroxyacid dehydrogenase
VIDTTTGDPDGTEGVASLLAARGVAYLDATISGSSQQVRAGEAVFMVGGTPQAFAECGELLRIASPRVFHVGPTGAGCRAKLASNLVLGLNRAALAEGLVFAEQLGLETGPFLRLLMSTVARSAIMASKGPKMVAGNFQPQARLRQHRKDVAIILEYAQRAGQELPLSRAHLDLLDSAIEAGDGDLDNSAVIRQIRRSRET